MMMKPIVQDAPMDSVVSRSVVDTMREGWRKIERGSDAGPREILKAISPQLLVIPTSPEGWKRIPQPGKSHKNIR